MANSVEHDLTVPQSPSEMHVVSVCTFWNLAKYFYVTTYLKRSEQGQSKYWNF